MKTDANYAQKDLVKSIRSGGLNRERAIKYIFHHSPLRGSVFQYILKQGGQQRDAEEILSEAIADFDHKVRNKKSLQIDNAYAFLFTTCRRLWWNRQRKSLRFAKFKTLFGRGSDHCTHINDHLQKERISQRETELVGRLLDQLPPKGRKVLELWMQGCKMEEIARETGLANANTARNYKYRFLKKLSERVGQGKELRALVQAYRMERA